MRTIVGVQSFDEVFNAADHTLDVDKPEGKETIVEASKRDSSAITRLAEQNKKLLEQLEELKRKAGLSSLNLGDAANKPATGQPGSKPEQKPDTKNNEQAKGSK